jgi:SHS2 domain-containing protein
MQNHDNTILFLEFREYFKKYNYPLMVSKDSGFREQSHTSDWALHVWAASLPALFVEAARGMNNLSGSRPAQSPLVKRSFSAEATDNESLLVLFLSELVFHAEQENLVFNEFELDVQDSKLNVFMSGAPILSISKYIKAVTFHNLHIQKTEAGFQVDVVFDV